MSPADRRPKVVVLHHDAAVRRFLHARLADQGFAVMGEAGDAIDGLLVVIRHEPDIVILDVTIGGGRAAAMAEVIRELVPEAAIVGFSAALNRAPRWADDYLNPDRLDLTKRFHLGE
jgi:DNA-binding NarL/FixJ family response regulator